MRLRDLRWYILASLVLIISYAAIALFYYLPVRSQAEHAMSTLGVELSKNVELTAESRLKELYDTFQNDTNVLDTDFSQQETLYSKFEKTLSTNQGICFYNDDDDRKIVFAEYSQFNPSDRQDSNTGRPYTGDYYFYFLNETAYNPKTGTNSGLIGRISLFDLFKFTEGYTKKDVNFTLYLYKADGTLYFSNDDSLYRKFEIKRYYPSSSEYLDDVVYRLDYESMSDSNILNASYSITDDNLKEDGTFNSIYSINGQNGVLSGISFYGLYISTFVPITEPYLAIDWVVQNAFIFYGIGVLVIVAMFAILMLGCKRASRLLRVDRHAVEKTQSIVIRVDKEGNVIFTNRTFKQIYGVQKLLNVDKFYDVVSKEPILADIKDNKSFECELDINGTMRYFHLTPLYVLSSYYLMGTDITIDYLRRKHLEDMSGKNEITGCENSFTLTNQYRHIISNSNFYDIAFVEYNINKYDEIVGVFGRQNFNILLNEFLQIISDVYKGLNVYHMNDSKFMVVYPNINFDDVIEKINTSLDILRKPISIGRNHIYVKVKIVVYNLKKEESEEISLDTIKNKLDLALKNIADFSSKDYIVYEPAMDNVIEAAEEMEQDLIQGIKNEEFRMYLQPQYNVVDNVVDGFEALIRWENPKYIDKSPQAFIELAEQRGYMLDIGRFVIRESFALAKKLEPYHVHVSVNISPIQLLQVGFVGELIDEFKRLELKQGSVAIEITETFLMGNFQLVTEKLKRLKDMGFSIHLDDFCTGYSSMLYLKDLPCDTIKIDKEFTKYIETSKVHASIVKTIINLGLSLDMSIICEGVETQIQSDIVKKMGCKIIQGYLIGKAMTYDDAIQLLDKYNKKSRK